MNGYMKYIAGFSFLLGGLILGAFIEFFLLKKLRSSVTNTKWKGDDVLVYSLRGLVFVLFGLIGAYISFHALSFEAHVTKIGNNVFFGGFVLLVTIFFSRLVVAIIGARAVKTQGLAKSGSIMANIARIGVYMIGIMIILQGLGVSITPMLTALGVGGLAVALALQDTLSNLFSGIQVIASRQIRPGHYIRLGDSGEEGYVSDISWRNTIIRTLANNMVVVPNSKIAAAILTNYYLPDKEIAVSVDVRVGYESDLEYVERITIETAKAIQQTVNGAVRNHQPSIRYNRLSESGVNFSVSLRGSEFTDQYLIIHEFIKALHQSYSRNGILIPYPTRTIQLQQHLNDYDKAKE